MRFKVKVMHMQSRKSLNAKEKSLSAFHIALLPAWLKFQKFRSQSYFSFFTFFLSWKTTFGALKYVSWYGTWVLCFGIISGCSRYAHLVWEYVFLSVSISSDCHNVTGFSKLFFFLRSVKFLGSFVIEKERWETNKLFNMSSWNLKQLDTWWMFKRWINSSSNNLLEKWF